jgi:CubicO group peptidase (beta-lactamase class C family)
MKNLIRLIILVLSTSFLPLIINAQDRTMPVLTPGKPELEQVSAERLTRIDKMLQQAIDSSWLSNSIGLIARNGKIVYYHSFGKLVDQQPIPLNSIYRIASQTKAITSVAVMMLYEEGKFLLDDPISKYIPEFKNPYVITGWDAVTHTYKDSVKANSEITIRELLTHTSGLEYPEIGAYALLYARAGVPSFTSTHAVLADKIKALAKIPLVHQPGTEFTYSYSIDVLGYLVEKLSGMSLDQFLKQRIFNPLGMEDTYFYLPESKYGRLIPEYTENKEHKAVLWKFDGGLPMDYPKTKGTYFAGGAGLSSTIYDYAIFLQMLLNNGEYNGHRLLAKRTVELMTSNQIGNLPGGYLGSNRWGLGFMLITKEGQQQLGMTEGSFVWGGAFNTVYWVDPKEKIVALLYINQAPLTHSEIPNKFKAMVYQALMDQ